MNRRSFLMAASIVPVAAPALAQAAARAMEPTLTPTFGEAILGEVGTFEPLQPIFVGAQDARADLIRKLYLGRMTCNEARMQMGLIEHSDDPAVAAQMVEHDIFEHGSAA